MIILYPLMTLKFWQPVTQIFMLRSKKYFDITWWTHLKQKWNVLLLTVCSYRVTYVFQSEFTLYNCLNVMELLARNRREIWSLSDCSGTRTHNHLFRKRTLNFLAKLASLAVDSSPVAVMKLYFNDIYYSYSCCINITIVS